MVDSKRSSEEISEGAVHKQKRALLTRQELLRSAREIFASDGFEHARLEDIAASAGKTRGALYANFKDKEDIFYTIFEDAIQQDATRLGPLLLGLPDLEQRIEALVTYLSHLSNDRERTLLNLEFKLYAIRHPRKRKRFADLQAAMCLRCSIPELDELRPLSENDPGERSPSARLIGSLAIGGVLDGLALNHLFNPAALDSREIAHYLKLCLQSTLQQFSDREVVETVKAKRLSRPG
jgi:AcrR family transcriptional regulator